MATAPFAPYEWMIAWRYLRAKRAEGGVSVMTWISLVGVTLAVFALVATLAVRSGFREEFVDTILGSNAHVTIYQEPLATAQGARPPPRGSTPHVTIYQEPLATAQGTRPQPIPEPEAVAARIREVPGVTRAAPL